MTSLRPSKSKTLPSSRPIRATPMSEEEDNGDVVVEEELSESATECLRS